MIDFNQLTMSAYHDTLSNSSAPLEYPTEHFTSLDPRNPEIAYIYVVQKGRATDYVDLNLWNARSGNRASVLLRTRADRF